MEVRTRAEWRAWLEAHHASHGPIWLASWKKGTPHYLSYDAIVEEALCFGWIDSTARGLDAERSMLLLAPRKPKSVWSALNKRRVEELERSGAMTAAGRAKIEAAKADGSWAALDAVDRLEMPHDLADALGERGRATYETYPPFLRKQVLYWINSAKRPETRAKRITEIVSDATEGRRPARWSG
ncbi:MAG TPA: YdeI/OmpD-associated family protein [Longimicrobium sp.]|nr:YdeI/OmpD-associated family protein [Longimicrobium sp.]